MNEHSLPVRGRYAACMLAAGLVLAAVAGWVFFPPGQVEAFIAERGPLEDVTVALYGVLFLVLCLNRARAADKWAHAALMVVTVDFAAREMDLHRAWTGASMLKLSYYLGDAPFGRKLVPLLVLAVALLALGYLALRYGAWALRRLRRHDPVAITIAAFVLVLVASKSLDRANSILLQDYGVAVSTSMRLLLVSLEEWLELGLPLLMGLGMLQYRQELPAA